MTRSPGHLTGLFAAILFVSVVHPAIGAEISPHRALYTMTLASAKPSSGVLGASGAMVYEWGETCDGWTVQQRFRLRLVYADSDPLEMSSSLVSWESKDGLNYRFNERRLKNGESDEELRGEAHLDGPGKGGKAEFSKPQSASYVLAPGVLFPTAHTILLVDSAKKGETFISRNVFDGSTLDNASQVSAVIGTAISPDIKTVGSTKESAKGERSRVDQTQSGQAKDGNPASPLLDQPSRRVRLAFFSSDTSTDEPDYELGMRLYDNGVSSDMSLDYSDYVVHAHLDEIEPLPKPSC